MRWQEIARFDNIGKCYKLIIRGENLTKDREYSLKLIKVDNSMCLLDTNQLTSIDEIEGFIEVTGGEYTLIDTEKEQQLRDIKTCYKVLHRLEKEIDKPWCDSVNDVKEIVNDMMYLKC